MPWKATCAVEERLQFIADWLKGEVPMSLLCEQYRDQPEDGLQVGVTLSVGPGGWSFGVVPGAASSWAFA